MAEDGGVAEFDGKYSGDCCAICGLPLSVHPHTYSLNVSMPNFPLIIRFAFFLAVCGLIGGILAPRRIRLVTAAGGLIISSVILAVPIILWR